MRGDGREGRDGGVGRGLGGVDLWWGVPRVDGDRGEVVGGVEKVELVAVFGGGGGGADEGEERGGEEEGDL